MRSIHYSSILLMTLLIFMSCVTASAQSTLYDSLKVHYKFSNNITDSSGGGWDLSSLSGSKFTYVDDREGNANSAIHLTGSNGLRSQRFSNSTWKEETVALWYKQDGNTAYQVMLQGANLGFAFTLRYITTDQVTSWVDGSSSDAFAVPCVVPDTFWHHIAITNNGSLSKIYWDGILAGSVSETLSVASGSPSIQNIYVACSNSGYSYKGTLDEIVLYNRVLDACDIKELYLQELCPIQFFDTTTFIDTIVIAVFDTTFVNDTTFTIINDTNVVDVFDTTHVTINDTTRTTIYDTIFVYDYVTIYDTSYVTIYDTNNITTYDTVIYTRNDTTFYSVSDTLYIDVRWTDTSSVQRLKVYPNPTNDKITIDFGEFLVVPGNRVIIYNIIGQKLFDQPVTQRFMDIALKGLGFSSGHYNLVIVNAKGQEIAVKRLILH